MGAGAVGGAAPAPSGNVDRGSQRGFYRLRHGRDSLVRARLALDRDGRFLALDTKVFANLGAHVSTVAPAVPTMAMAARWVASTTFR